MDFYSRNDNNKKTSAERIKHFIQYTYSVHASSSQLLNVSSRLKSTSVDMPLPSQVKSSRMCSSRPPSTWGHFILKLGHVSVPQRLAGLIEIYTPYAALPSFNINN